jgi:hypothetical protein
MCRGALTLSILLLLAGCGGSARLEVVIDDCPNDDEKIYPGECGCGTAESRCRPLKDALVHRYGFDGTGAVAVDDVGGADGAIMNTQLSGLGQLYLDRRAEPERHRQPTDQRDLRSLGGLGGAARRAEASLGAHLRFRREHGR